MTEKVESCASCLCYQGREEIREDHPLPHLQHGQCRRFPQVVRKAPDDFCFEFMPREKARRVRAPARPAADVHAEEGARA